MEKHLLFQKVFHLRKVQELWTYKILLKRWINQEEMIKVAIATVQDKEKIATLEKNVEKLGRPNAAEVIADEVIKLADAYIEKNTRG